MFEIPELNLGSVFYGKGDVHIAEGGDRIEASRRILSNAKEEIKNLEQLPSNVSQKDLEHEAGVIAEKEASLDLLREVVSLRKRRLAAAAQEYQLTADYQGEVQSTVRKIAKADTKFAQKLASHGVLMGVEEAQVNGYQQAHRNAKTLIAWQN